MDPLPATEIRARGDRLRRRRTAVSVTGAAAAVAAVALTASLLGGGVDGSSPAPATTSPTQDASATTDTAPSTIPSDVPLAVGLPPENLDGSPVEVSSAPGVEPLELCGQTVLDPGGAVDIVGVTYSGGEDYRERTLLLFGSDAAAADYLSGNRGAVSACPTTLDDANGNVLLVEPVDAQIGDESFSFATRFQNAGPLTGLSVYHAVRLGSTVLVASQAGETGNTAQSRASRATDAGVAVREVVAALGGPTIAADPAPGTTIPADFPLDLDQVAMTGDGGEKAGPAGDAPGLETITLCGQDIWPIAPNERLASNATGPEYADSRELVRFLDAEAAVNVLTALRQRVRSCPSEPVEGGTSGGGRVHAVQQVDLGYENVTFAVYFGDGGLGLTVYQFVRVGSGVLALAESSEGNEAGIAGTVADLTALSEVLAPQMCVFTQDGCPG